MRPFSPRFSRGASSLRPVAVLAAALTALACGSGTTSPGGALDAPTVLDERLTLTLFAEDPDIVTPIGLAFDMQDRLFVLESHTHVQPATYPGPKGDRVKVFTDRDKDGRADTPTVFAEGLEDGMNMAFSPDGVLYVVTSRTVWALRDEDGDGVSESRDRIVHLVEPAQVYDHAGLLGLAFSPDGWLYLSRGNTGGQAWRLEGTDGSWIGGYGDGGNIARCRADGSALEEVATGFWNPFDLKVDAHGRVLAIDNDPDSRGPNRLVHVIPGGDYGYQSLYGGSGIHPYLAWNGEHPGTLPYAAGLGEAPSGLLEAGRAALPSDYAGDVLVTIWEESKIVRVRLTPEGVSVTGTVEPVLEGSQQFRPVALAADGKGTIYVTDWVLRAYPNHGRGRIWRLATRPDVAHQTPRSVTASPLPDVGMARLQDLGGAASVADFERLRTALTSDDPFVRAAAVTTLARPVFRTHVIAATQDPAAAVRLGALLALRKAGHNNAELIARRLLTDTDPRVRQMALVWIGEETMVSLRDDVARILTTGTVSPALFETYLATVRHLQPAFAEAYRQRAAPVARQLQRVLPSGFLPALIADTTKPVAVRALALTHLTQPEVQADLLLSLAGAGAEEAVRLEAVRTLARVDQPEIADVLVEIAQTRSNPVALRAEALLGLAQQEKKGMEEVVPLLNDPEPAVRLEAVRYLRTQPLSAPTRALFNERYTALQGDPLGNALREQLAFIVAPEDAQPANRPRTMEAWQEALAQGGDPHVGRRVFYSVQAQCSQCHTVQQRGGTFGPDLTHVGQSKSRAQLVRAILRPSEEIAPAWQGWFVETSDGRVHLGRQINISGTGKSVELMMLDGTFATYTDVARYGTSDASLMPAGLDARLTVSDLRDLVAFLAREE